MSADEALEAYLAGRVTAENAVAAVAAEYYGEQGARSKERLQPLIEIIERAHPGVVELTGSNDRPGFAVRLAERPFPKRYESQLRSAASAALETYLPSPIPLPASRPSLWQRVVRAVRRIFNA